MKHWLVMLSLGLCGGVWGMDGLVSEKSRPARCSPEAPFADEVPTSGQPLSDALLSSTPDWKSEAPGKVVIDPQKNALVLCQKGKNLYVFDQKLETLDQLTSILKDALSAHVAHYAFACQGDEDIGPSSAQAMSDAIRLKALVKILKGFCSKTTVDHPEDSICSAWAFLKESPHFRSFKLAWDEGDLFDKTTVNARIDRLELPIFVTESQLLIDTSEPFYALRFHCRLALCGFKGDVEAFQADQDLSKIPPKDGDAIRELRCGGDCLIPVSLFNEMEAVSRAGTTGDQNIVDFEHHLAKMIWINQNDPIFFRIPTAQQTATVLKDPMNSLSHSLTKEQESFEHTSDLSGSEDEAQQVKGMAFKWEGMRSNDAEVGVGAGLVDPNAIAGIIHSLCEPSSSSGNSSPMSSFQGSTQEKESINVSGLQPDDEEFVMVAQDNQ